jgi:hypothetical protein
MLQKGKELLHFTQVERPVGMQPFGRLRSCSGLARGVVDEEILRGRYLRSKEERR